MLPTSKNWLTPRKNRGFLCEVWMSFCPEIEGWISGCWNELSILRPCEMTKHSWKHTIVVIWNIGKKGSKCWQAMIYDSPKERSDFTIITLTFNGDGCAVIVWEYADLFFSHKNTLADKVSRKCHGWTTSAIVGRVTRSNDGCSTFENGSLSTVLVHGRGSHDQFEKAMLTRPINGWPNKPYND